MERMNNGRRLRKTLHKPKGLGIRYSDLDIQKRVEIYNFALEKAKEMISKNELNLHELSRIIMRNYGVHIWPATIRDWVIGRKHPLRNPQLNPITKAPRRPPDPQIIPTTLGLLYSDLHFRTIYNTLVLSLTTTYEAFARNIARLYLRYGYINIAPILCREVPEWRLNIYLDRASWNKIFMTPLSSLSKEETRVFLTRVIDGDGWITLNYGKKRPTFLVAISSCYADKAGLFSELFQKLGYQAAILIRSPRIYDINGRAVKQKRRERMIVLYRKGDVIDLLRSTKFLHPMKEVKRRWALKMIDSGLSMEKSKKIWRYLRQVEKTAKIYSKLRAALILSEKQDVLNTIKNLKKKYVESVRLLKQLRVTLTL